MRGSYAVRRPVANDYLVRERDRRRARELVRIVVRVLPLALALLSYIAVQLAVWDEAYRARELEGRLHELTRTERRLWLEAVRQEAPSLIEQRAVEQLGMAAPQPQQVVFWEDLR